MNIKARNAEEQVLIDKAIGPLSAEDRDDIAAFANGAQDTSDEELERLLTVIDRVEPFAVRFAIMKIPFQLHKTMITRDPIRSWTRRNAALAAAHERGEEV